MSSCNCNHRSSRHCHKCCPTWIIGPKGATGGTGPTGPPGQTLINNAYLESLVTGDVEFVIHPQTSPLIGTLVQFTQFLIIGSFGQIGNTTLVINDIGLYEITINAR